MTLPIPTQRIAVTTTKMPNAVRKTTIPETLTSVPSYPSEVSTFGFSFGSCVCMFRLQYLRQMRVVGHHQRTRCQVGAVVRCPQRSHRHRYRDVLKNPPAEVQVPRSILEVRLDQPEQIECLGEDHPLANLDQTALVLLDVLREQ